MKQRNNHIVIITGQHMTANPRVWKEANSLAEAGYRVSVLTTFYDRAKIVQDKQLLHPAVKYKASVNLIKGEGSLTEVFLSRFSRKLAMIKKALLKKDSNRLIAYLPSRQVRKALAEEADLYIAHQEAGLIIGCALLRRGKKVAFDFEDWYSRDYINQLRPVRLLEKSEHFALLNGAYYTCPSVSMADAIRKAYQLDKAPEVIYNSFSRKEGIVVQQGYCPDSMVWFSQVVGPGRGLETLCKALEYINKPININLLGKCDDIYRRWITTQVPGRHQVCIHDVIPHEKIIPFLSQFTVGLAIEHSSPENKATTVSNKMLQYLQAGLKVIATDTKGQREVASFFPKTTVSLVEQNKPEQWAKAFEFFLSEKNVSRTEIVKLYDEHFSWEVQSPKLLSLVSAAII